MEIIKLVYTVTLGFVDVLSLFLKLENSRPLLLYVRVKLGNSQINALNKKVYALDVLFRLCRKNILVVSLGVKLVNLFVKNALLLAFLYAELLKRRNSLVCRGVVLFKREKLCVCPLVFSCERGEV